MSKKNDAFGMLFTRSVDLILGQVYLLKIDNDANDRFASKARNLQLEGKPKDFVRSNFGEPIYEYVSDERLIWVFTPGPSLVFWRHECKVGFNEQGLVDAWVVRSD